MADELQHFYRSYAMATGDILPERRGDQVGSELPSSLPETIEAFSKTRELHANHPWLKMDSSGYARELARPLDPDRHEFVAYPDAAIVGPAAYLPQALGMRIGIALGGSPLELLYLGRTTNMLTAVAIIWFAIGRLGVGRTVACTLLMFPTVQAQISSLSSDAMLVALGIAVTALPLSPLGSPARESRLLAAATILGILLVTAKGVYITLVAFAAVLFWYRAARLGLSKQGARSALLAVALVLLISLAWGHVIDHLMVKSRPTAQTIDPVAQVAFILSHPLRFLWTLIVSMVTRIPNFIQSVVGLLGWGSIQIGIPGYLSAGLATLLAFMKRDRPAFVVPDWMRLFAVGTFLGTWVLIEVALYLRWTPVGASLIDGVQGRYFLPIMFVLALLQNPSGRPLLPERWHGWALIAFATFPVLAAHAAVLRAFY